MFTEQVPLWSPGSHSYSSFPHSESPPHPFPHSMPPPTLLLSLTFQFLILCLLVQPTSYTDASILGLMELLCRAGLDVGLRLLPKTDLQQLLLLLLENIQEWPGKVHSLGSATGDALAPGAPRVGRVSLAASSGVPGLDEGPFAPSVSRSEVKAASSSSLLGASVPQLQPLCCALSWVSDHHHNLLALVQFFLDVTPRGRWVLLSHSAHSLMLIPTGLFQDLESSLPAPTNKLSAWFLKSQRKN